MVIRKSLLLVEIVVVVVAVAEEYNVQKIEGRFRWMEG